VRVTSGLVFMVASAFSFSVMSALVKAAEVTLPTAEIVLARAAITLVLSFAMVSRAGVSRWGTRRGSLVLRGTFGFLALAGYYWTLGRLPLAEASTMHHTAPIWTAILAGLVLREPLGRGTVVALVLGMAGVVLVARPTSFVLDGGGFAISLAAAVCSAAAYVTVRRLAATEHPLVIVFYFPLVAFPASLAWAAPQWVMPTAREGLLLLGVGVTTQIGQVCLTYGLSREPAARAMSIGYLQVAFAVLWGAIAFGELPPWTTAAGAALIVVGTVAVASAGSRAKAAPAGGHATAEGPVR